MIPLDPYTVSQDRTGVSNSTDPYTVLYLTAPYICTELIMTPFSIVLEVFGGINHKSHHLRTFHQSFGLSHSNLPVPPSPRPPLPTPEHTPTLLPTLTNCTSTWLGSFFFSVLTRHNGPSVQCSTIVASAIMGAIFISSEATAASWLPDRPPLNHQLV